MIKILKNIKSVIQGLFLTFMILFFAAGSLPQYFDYWNIDTIEIVENTESETPSEKKETNEKESDKFLGDFLLFPLSAYKYPIPTLSHEFKYRSNLFTDNATPPPEVV